MKIRKHLLACGVVAGLAGMSGVAESDRAPYAHVQVGYLIAKNATEAYDLDEDTEDMVQAGSQAAGATIGAATGAYLGAKIGLAFGIFGAVAGAAIGAV